MDNAENTKLYVGNISWNTQEATIRAAFEEFGAITDFYFPMDSNDRGEVKPRGFAFVTFETAEQATAAKDALSNQEMDGRRITVDYARPKAPRTERGGNFNRRDNYRDNDRNAA
jgi:cold-inducible RNA-binding protein